MTLIMNDFRVSALKCLVYHGFLLLTVSEYKNLILSTREAEESSGGESLPVSLSVEQDMDLLFATPSTPHCQSHFWKSSFSITSISEGILHFGITRHFCKQTPSIHS